MRTGRATPDSASNRCQGAPEQTSGTSAGRVSIDAVAELPGQGVAPVAGADLGNRKAAGGDHQARRLDRAARGLEAKAARRRGSRP